jgi:hypothetical protein
LFTLCRFIGISEVCITIPWVTFFPRSEFCIDFDPKKWVGLHFGRLFPRAHLVTLVNKYDWVVFWLCQS